MVVRIRLARFGKRNAPFYNIVVANARYARARVQASGFRALTMAGDRTARNSKPLEVLGTYDPIPKHDPDGEGRPFKDIKLDLSRAKYWLGVGAQPSDPAWKLLSMVCVAHCLKKIALYPIETSDPDGWLGWSAGAAVQQDAGARAGCKSG